MKLQSKELFFFNDETHIKGANTQHKVVIQTLDNKTLKTPLGLIETPYVEGYLQNEFNYSVNADWQPMLDGLLDKGLLARASVFTGNPLFQSGLFKRKFYKGGGYISFSIDIRLVSEQHSSINSSEIGLQGSGKITNPKTAAHWLSSLCLPTTDPSALTMLKGVSNTAVEGGKQVFDIVTNPVDAVKKDLAQLGDAASKPYARTIRVQIGNMFDSSDMIVEQVDLKYSRQQVLTQYDGFAEADDDHPSNNILGYQPLYVDVTLRVSTRTIPTVDKDGSANTGLLKPQPSVSIATEVVKPLVG